jgi:hypothetical protein
VGAACASAVTASLIPYIFTVVVTQALRRPTLAAKKERGEGGAPKLYFIHENI